MFDTIIYLDCPIYKPTLTALKYFYPLIPKGGVVAFDEISMEKWKGETLAFKEYLKNLPKFEKVLFLSLQHHTLLKSEKKN